MSLGGDSDMLSSVSDWKRALRGGGLQKPQKDQGPWTARMGEREVLAALSFPIKL